MKIDKTQKECVILGRVLAVNKDKVQLIYSGSSLVNVETKFCYDDIKAGDIVTLIDNNQTKSCQLVTRPIQNPFDQNKSLPSKFLNESIAKQLEQREKFADCFRDFFAELNYLEVKSPVLVDSPGVETYLEPFATEYYDYCGISHKFYLPTSPEYGLKAYLGASLTSVFSFARSFRNCGEESNRHKKEFTMLEWYIVLQNYKYIIDQTEAMLNYAIKKFTGGNEVTYQGKTCDFSKSNKYSMRKLFADFDIELDDYTDNPEKFVTAIKTFYNDKDINLAENMNIDDYFFKFFMDNIEPNLGFDHPTIVYDYPLQMCPLSVPSEENPRYGQRFEAYIFGIEVANGYTELTDYNKQKENFEIVLEQRLKTGAKVPVGLPEFFLDSLRNGIPPCTGCALGFDRVFMIVQDLDDVHKGDWY